MNERERVVSTTITHPRHIELNAKCQGVAIIVVNRENEVLLAQQQYDDLPYGRVQGQWNIITETREEGEFVRGTVWRAIQEELGCTPDDFSVLGGTYKETNNTYNKYLGYRYFYRCIALVYTAHPGTDPNALFHSHDGEIVQFAWVPFHQLNQYDIEYGARLVLDDYREELDKLWSHFHKCEI